jgi:hypothetical protein
MCITYLLILLSSGTIEDIEQEENYLKEYNGSKVRDGQADLLPLDCHYILEIQAIEKAVRVYS